MVISLWSAFCYLDDDYIVWFLLLFSGNIFVAMPSKFPFQKNDPFRKSCSDACNHCLQCLDHSKQSLIRFPTSKRNGILVCVRIALRGCPRVSGNGWDTCRYAGLIQGATSFPEFCKYSPGLLLLVPVKRLLDCKQIVSRLKLRQLLI